MYFSAARSRSSVVMPGRIFVSTSFSVRTRIAPAAAIASISAGLFLMIMRPGGPPPAAQYDLRNRPVAGPPPAPLELVLEAQRGDRRPDVVVDLGGRTRAVEAPQEPALLVVLDERRGRCVVDLEPLADDLR